MSTYWVTPTVEQCARTRAKRVVYIDIAQRRQLLAELFSVLGFLLAETGILQQNYIAGLHRGNRSLGILAYYCIVVRKYNLLAQMLRQALCNRRQRKLCFRTILGLAQMRAKDYLASVRDQLLDRGQCERFDSSVITPSFIGTLKSQRTSTRLSFT